MIFGADRYSAPIHAQSSEKRHRLRDVQGRRGIVDFRVVCDETNNTGEVIDSNRFVADIYIKPARSINFITLNFIAARTSVNFEEIGA